jgi:hypothetical protein
MDADWLVQQGSRTAFTWESGERRGFNVTRGEKLSSRRVLLHVNECIIIHMYESGS